MPTIQVFFRGLDHLAVLGDLLIINPTYWWSDVFRGEGTPFEYTSPEVPQKAPAGDEEPSEDAA